MSKEDEMVQKIAQMLNTGSSDDFENVMVPMSEQISESNRKELDKLVIKPSLIGNVKDLKPFKTGTFLDSMFLDSDDNVIGGVPFGSNSILTGLPNSGKSIFVEEVALRVANNNNKVCFVTSEEIFRAESGRMDLENRMKQKADLLGLDWSIISENLFVLDSVNYAELRDWYTFAKTYRNLVESNKIEFLIIDSLTLLEDSRGRLKYRLLELIKYGQKNGVTSILVNQRATDDADSLSLAGGLALSHSADVVFVLDYKKVSSWDKQLKIDIEDVKQGQIVNFFRILKCRMGRYRANYFAYEITKDGLVTLL